MEPVVTYQEELLGAELEDAECSDALRYGNCKTEDRSLRWFFQRTLIDGVGDYRIACENCREVESYE